MYVNSLRLLQLQPNPPLALSVSHTFIFGFFWSHTVIKGRQHHVTSLQCSLCLKSLQKSDKKKNRKVNWIICWWNWCKLSVFCMLLVRSWRPTAAGHGNGKRWGFSDGLWQNCLKWVFNAPLAKLCQTKLLKFSAQTFDFHFVFYASRLNAWTIQS